jgi:hypothetical protein
MRNTAHPGCQMPSTILLQWKQLGSPIKVLESMLLELHLHDNDNQMLPIPSWSSSTKWQSQTELRYLMQRTTWSQTYVVFHRHLCHTDW